MMTLIIIGDIVVCAIIIALVAWIFARDEDKHLREAAHIPLLDDEQSWRGGEESREES